MFGWRANDKHAQLVFPLFFLNIFMYSHVDDSYFLVERGTYAGEIMMTNIYIIFPHSSVLLLYSTSYATYFVYCTTESDFLVSVVLLVYFLVAF